MVALKTAFVEYVEEVAERLRPTRGGAGPLYVLRNPLVELNTIVETLEQSESFKRLMEATQHEFPPKGVGIVNYWQFDIQHFFPRTGSYENIYGGQAINLDGLFQGYLAALQRETVQVRCLAPINAVDFGMIPLDLGEFSIREFSKAELDVIFENERRRLFYPLSVVDSTRLEAYWCIALGFLVKAFFSEGSQQLLWHISTVEALVGEKKESLTDLLGRRVGCVIGKTKKERATIQKRFKKLYDFRSDLVHGNRELLKENKIHFGHLREARRIARESLVWFLKCLDQIERWSIEDPCEAGLPKREEVLASLDMKSDSRGRVQWLLGKLPAEFPHVPEWDDAPII